GTSSAGSQEPRCVSALLFSQANRKKLRRKSRHACNLRRTCRQLSPVAGKRSQFAGGGSQWSIHPDHAPGLRRGGWTRRTGLHFARRRGSRPRRKSLWRKNIFSLRRRHRQHPYVSKLRPAPRRLDQEPRITLSLHHPAGRSAGARVYSDRLEFLHRRRRLPARPLAPGGSGSSIKPAVIRGLPSQNPQSPLRLGCEPARLVRPPALLLFIAVLEENARERHRAVEGQNVL